MDPQMDTAPDAKLNGKTPVVRGARACTVCRTAKMKCVGAEDGQKQCQRCKRANVECVFEKHRRGRKPGSKLSDASKMLRRLEKGLNSAKAKSHSAEAAWPDQDGLRVPASSQDTYSSTPRSSAQPYSTTNSHFAPNEGQTSMQSYQSGDGYPPSVSSRSQTMEDDKDDFDRNDEALFPEKLIQENKRNSFFRTILNPESSLPTTATRSTSYTPPPTVTAAHVGLSDPITAGIVTEKEVQDLLDLVFLRLNPFINLFDPSLHTVQYVRSRCPFLFTTLVMAGCKFFRPEKYRDCQRMAEEYAVRAFAEGWKRVEVVQAFACLTYWKDPTDNKTWTYIGYACRMAVELGLNRYISHPSPAETDFQRLERRNRERTYLVLFVHDRSLSMQTGRHWMLPEDDLIKNANTWHEGSGTTIRPEDVIIAAFVALRRIAAETTDIFNTAKHGLNGNTDINYDMVLSHCNGRLTQWDDNWRAEMAKARGEKFHFKFLTFFRLHVRLFLNSFGIQASLHPYNRQPPSLQALMSCSTSAYESLHIVSEDFHGMKLLRYGQESITVMTAYSAIFLLRLLRTPSGVEDMASPENVHALIMKTADSYEEASRFVVSSVSMAASYHARFLRSLVENDIFKSRRGERERNDNMPIDPRLQGAHAANGGGGAEMYQRVPDQSFHFPASPHLPAHPHQAAVQAQAAAAAAAAAREHDGYTAAGAVGAAGGEAMAPRSLGNAPLPVGQAYPGAFIPPAPPTTEQDQRYWKNMFIELGFGESETPLAMQSVVMNAQYVMAQQQQQQQGQEIPPLQAYQGMHGAGYAH